jgi:hypothetical protein
MLCSTRAHACPAKRCRRRSRSLLPPDQPAGPRPPRSTAALVYRMNANRSWSGRSARRTATRTESRRAVSPPSRAVLGALLHRSLDPRNLIDQMEAHGLNYSRRADVGPPTHPYKHVDPEVIAQGWRQASKGGISLEPYHSVGRLPAARAAGPTDEVQVGRRRGPDALRDRSAGALLAPARAHTDCNAGARHGALRRARAVLVPARPGRELRARAAARGRGPARAARAVLHRPPPRQRAAIRAGDAARRVCV